MEQDNKQPSNVIQFPGRKKDTDTPSVETPAAPTAEKKPARKKKNTKTLAGSVLAVFLATYAVNQYTFKSEGSAELASMGTNPSRAIASVERVTWERDANWEKQLAESLASPKAARDVASAHIGRAATAADKLRWGILEEKYTITYEPAQRTISSVLLQGEAAEPSYILDRPKFLREYGHLFAGEFSEAKLKSVEQIDDKTIEQYIIFDKQNRAAGEARFELDRHKRLISLKVEPQQI